jgi:hypothetical protein
MRAVIKRVAAASTKAKKDKILQEHGLHNIEVRLQVPESYINIITNKGDCSIFYGILGFLILIRHFHMIRFILTTWESGENTYGNFCSRYWRITA